MFKAHNNPSTLFHHEKELSSKFSLLVWNIHKENQTEEFKKQLHQFTQKYQTDLLLFQEVKYSKKRPFQLEDYSFALAGNIETKQYIFGVLTATKSSFTQITPTLSTKKELGFISHKSFLISKHKMQNKKELTVLNLHAINFVTTKIFEHELSTIESILSKLDGPLIVAGDFNSWSKKRHKLLKNFQQNLGLKKVEVANEKNVKKIFSHMIDYIYYRELKPLQATAIETKKVSDHNPIYALFELL